MPDAVATVDLGEELLWTPMRIVPPGPWAGHVPFAFWLVKALRPGMFVELGTHTGNSYFAFCQAMAAFTPSARAFAVDTWHGDQHAGEYGEEVYAEVAAFNAGHFSAFSTLLRTTFDAARAYFPDGTPEDGIDLLHIDGMHAYDAVRHDFETWRSALSGRAVVLFHDINVRERGFGVWRLWRELADQYPAFAFDHSNGLGVLGIGGDQAPSLRWLFGADPDAAGAFRRRVAARGEVFQLQAELLSTRELIGKGAAEAAASAAANAGLAAKEARAQTEIAWRDAVIEATREASRAKESLVAVLADRAAGLLQVIAERDRIITARDEQQASAGVALARQQFLVSEERRVRDEMQAGYEAAIAGLTRNLHDTREQSAAQAAAVAQGYVNTASWKVTRPLRLATRLLRGQRLRPEGLPIEPTATPTAAEPAQPAAVVAPDAPAPMAARKTAMRDLFAARLRAFLAGSETLRLPRAEQPDVSVILVLHNQADLTFACLGSIVETLAGAPFGVEVVIADNGSTDDTGTLLERVEGATVLTERANLHFLKAVNAAARQARGRAILLLNNDAQLLPGAVASALAILDADDGVGAVGGRIILPDGTLQEAGSIIWRDGACSGYARGEPPETPDVMFQRDVDYCSGAFLLTPTPLWRQMGGFDERFAPAYYEETDYCARLWQAGRRVVYDPNAVILHYEFGSAGNDADALRLQAANHAVFVAGHEDWLAGQFTASPLNVLAARTGRSAAPRILVIEDRVPRAELGTGYPRINRLLHELVAAGAQVALYPMFRHAETWHGVRRALDKRIEVLISGDKAQLRAYLVARRGHFDAILVCRPTNMAAFIEAVGSERDLIGAATVLYDAEALFVTRDLQRREADGDAVPHDERQRMVAAEVTLTRLADTVVSVSPAEQAVLEDYGARDVRLLAHALDEQPVPTGWAERDQIVFLGAIGEDAAPNADAVRWFAAEILPGLRQALDRPELRLTVVGRNAAPTVAALDGDALDLLGMVDELPPALARARVMVVPTRFAAGIPHKAHQAAMLGIPMVVTSLIARQLDWQAEAELLVADDPAAFAAACARLYADAALWERIRAAALARVRLDCAPEAFTRTVRALVDGLRIVHRLPEGVAAPLPPAVPQPPNASRPLAADWSVAVPFGFAPAPVAAPEPKLAVVCHLFHTSVAAELRFYARNLPTGTGLFLSTDTQPKADDLRAAFADWDRGPVEVRVMPNRGRDIAPKLVGFADVHANHDLVLHLHSKMSTHAAFLRPWRSYLFETLLGSPEIVASVMDAFARLPDLGMVAPQHFEAIRRWLDWRGNFDTAHGLAARMGIALSPSRAVDFPSGSMFWARPAALRPLLDLRLSFADFPVEGEQVDDTPAHAIERLYFYACERSGHTWLKVAQPALLFDSSTVQAVPTPAALSRFVAEHGVLLTGPGAIATRADPAPMVTRVAPGLATRLAARAL